MPGKNDSNRQDPAAAGALLDGLKRESVASFTARDCYITLNGLKFHYAEWGAADAPAVIMLHGLRSYAMTFEPLATLLCDRFRVISLDQRGRGLSDWDPAANYYADQYVSDLGALVDALSLGRFHLLGHSLGAINALYYSRDHGERLLSLILEEYGPGSEAQGAGQDRIKRELQQTPLKFESWAQAARFWRGARPHISEDALASRLKYSLKETADGIVWRHDQAGIAQARLEPAPGHALPDLWPAVRKLGCPTLLLRGARSDYLSAETAEKMARLNERIQIEEIPEAGHYAHDDNALAFERAVLRFLSSVETPLC